MDIGYNNQEWSLYRDNVWIMDAIPKDRWPQEAQRFSEHDTRASGGNEEGSQQTLDLDQGTSTWGGYEPFTIVQAVWL